MSDLARNAVIAAILLAFSIGSGALTTMQDPSTGEQLITILRDSILGETAETSGLVLAGKLFLNNLQACVVMFLGGASLGVLTVFVITVNGFVIGSVLELVRQEHSVVFMVAAVVPHGVFEIPAFLLSGALGFMLARALWNEWVSGNDAAAEALGLGRTFLFRVVPLVALAAVVEAFITPQILQIFI
ncbi:MAG: stage II sporulation protein M [Methanolinea sp.]|nr:stage II sporulation protein M [Methanolinea sp.]